MRLIPKRHKHLIRYLERAGYTVTLEEEAGESPMSQDVKSVSGIAKDIAGVNEKARTVAADLKANVDNLHAQLNAAQELSNTLRDAGAELQAVLGTHTNGGPKLDSN